MAKSEKSMVLYGRISIYERLKANPQSIEKVLMQDNISLEKIEELARRNKIPMERLPAHRLKKFKPAKDLQGVVARIKKFEYADYRELLDGAKDRKLSFIFLDRINDPQNVGAIIRTVACFGNFAVVIPQFHACGVTEAVLHVASGGENYIPVSMVANLSTAIIQAKEAGYWIAGAFAGDGASCVNKTPFPTPVGLVMGSEGEGIRYGVAKHLDQKFQIPMEGAKLSFNVAAACAIFCYEIFKQKEES